jgi:hypothetical protein
VPDAKTSPQGRGNTFMKYFAKFQCGSQTKNKAQEKAYTFGKTYASTLLSNEKALDKFVQKIQLGIDLINQSNPRCSDIDCRYRRYPDLKEYTLYCGEIFSYSFYPVEQELNVEETIERPDLLPVGESKSNIFNF